MKISLLSISIGLILVAGCSSQTVNVPPGCRTVYVTQWMNDPRTVNPFANTLPTNAVEQAAKGLAEGEK